MILNQIAAAAWAALTQTDESGHVVVTASATTIHTPGAWVELIAATTSESTYLTVEIVAVSVSNTNTATLLTVATGGAGNETPIVSDLPVGGALRCTISVPIAIPAGARVSARIQAIRLSQTASVRVFTYTGGQIAPGAVVTMGVDIATSGAVALGTAWTEVVASTTDTYRNLIIVPSIAGFTNAAFYAQVALGVGAAGSEVKLGQVSVFIQSTENWSDAGAFGLASLCAGVPAGSRLVMKRVNAPATAQGAIVGVI